MKRGGRHVTTAGSARARFTQSDVRAAVAGIRGSLSFKAPLREYTSFKIGGAAAVGVEPADVQAACLRGRGAGDPCPSKLPYENAPRSRSEGRRMSWLSRLMLRMSVWWSGRLMRARFRCLSWVGQTCLFVTGESMASWSAWLGCEGS